MFTVRALLWACNIVYWPSTTLQHRSASNYQWEGPPPSPHSTSHHGDIISLPPHWETLLSNNAPHGALLKACVSQVHAITRLKQTLSLFKVLPNRWFSFTRKSVIIFSIPFSVSVMEVLGNWTPWTLQPVEPSYFVTTKPNKLQEAWSMVIMYKHWYYIYIPTTIGRRFYFTAALLSACPNK